MNLVDVHCHLTHQLFKNDLDQVIQRAKQAGVKAIICSGVNHPSNLEALAIAKKYEIVKCSFGLYPIDLLGLAPDEIGITKQEGKIDLEEELEFIKKNKNNIVAVGECGLEFLWDKEHHHKQKENFLRIIKFVEKLNKPLIIHSRNANLEVMELLETSSIKKNKVILHCFEGRKHLLKKAAEKGYNFTIPAKIVKLQHFQLLAEIAPLTQLFTETDAPWLSPVAGERNEPASVAETIKKIAEIKKISREEVAGQIWKNYQKVFL